ncbi:MAG: hypothetical protein NC402_05640 [Prevotella sp.]|nr:hypothetical protein [Prevotella sp.]MCM1074568.1 hypothetical protein [Ruminococcus sp.]
MKKLLLFLSLLLVTWGVKAEVLLDLKNAQSSWQGNGYSSHTVSFDQADVILSAASKQSNMPNYPTTKQGDVTVKFKNGFKFSHIALNLKQWGTKKQTLKMSISTDGTNFNKVSGVGFTSGFMDKVESDITPDVTSVKFSFTGGDQIGIVSVQLTEEGGKKTLSVPIITVGQDSFTISAENPVKYCVNNSETAVADDCNLEYTPGAQIPFETDYGTWFVHAYCPGDSETNLDSSIATESYTVRDPNATEFTATVTMNAQTNQKYDKEGNNIVKWISDDNIFTFTTSVKVPCGNNPPVFNTDGLRLYTTSNNAITVNAPQGYKMVSVKYAAKTNTHTANIDGTKLAQNTVKTFNAPVSSFVITSNDNKIDITSMTFVLEKKQLLDYTAAFNCKEYTMTVGDSKAVAELIGEDLGEKYPANISYNIAVGGDIYVSLENGILTADKATGETPVTVNASWKADSDFNAGNASFTINVDKKVFTAPTIEPVTMTTGDEKNLASLFGENVPEIRFSVEPETDVITLTGSTIKAEKAGEATVKAEWGDDTWANGSMTISVTVTDKPVVELPKLATPEVQLNENNEFVITGDEENGYLVYSHTLADAEENWDIYEDPVKKETAPGKYVFKAQVWANDETTHQNSEVVNIEYTVEEVIEPEPTGQPLEVTFDFTTDPAYCLAARSDDKYESEAFNFTNKNIKVTLDGRYRLFKNTNGVVDLRFGKKSGNVNPGSITFTAPAGYELESIDIEYTGSDKNLTVNNGALDDNKQWTAGETKFSSVAFTNGVEAKVTPVKKMTVHMQPIPVYAPVASNGSGVYKHAVNVELAFDERNSYLNTDDYYIAYALDDEELSVDNSKSYSQPFTFKYQSNKADYKIRAAVVGIVDDEIKFISDVAEFTYTIVPEIEAVDLAKVLENANPESIAMGDDGISLETFSIVSSLHKYYADQANSYIYVTDNNGGKGIRIELPEGAIVNHNKVMNNVKVKYSNNHKVAHFVYVSHEEGTEDAVPSYRMVDLEEIAGDKAADFMHHYLYVHVANFNPDGNGGYKLEYTPASASESAMVRAEGESFSIPAVNATGSDIAEGGFGTMVGHIEMNGDTPTFYVTSTPGGIVTALDKVPAEGDVRVIGGQIYAPEGSGVFTVNGLRVSATAKQQPGMYIVRTANGNVCKVMVK